MVFNVLGTTDRSSSKAEDPKPESRPPRPWYEKALRNTCPGLWAAIILVIVVLLAIVGHFVHKWHEADQVPHLEEVKFTHPIRKQPHHTTPLPSVADSLRTVDSVLKDFPQKSKQIHDEAATIAGTTESIDKLPPVETPPPPPKQAAPDIRDDFPTCNPSATLLSNQDAFTNALGEPWCSPEQATIIRDLLVKLEYNFEAVVPKPYIYPARVLENLLSLDPHLLNVSLLHYQRTANNLGPLGTLVKLFAWGLPIHAQELLGAFDGDEVVEAFLRCNVITKCGPDSPVYVSTVQFFPVQNSQNIVVTDWPIQGFQQVLKQQSQVEVVDLHTLFLAHNTPVAKHMRVLDIGTDAGVMGFAAASTGAKEVVMLEPNPRAARFLRFSSALNDFTKVVRVVQKPSGGAEYLFKDKFFLVLAHATGTTDQKEATVRSLLQTSHGLLQESGSFVLGMEGYRCRNFPLDFAPEFCGDMDTGDFVGTVVCRRKKDEPYTAEPQEGIVYGWNGPKTQAGRDSSSCGHFTQVTIASFDKDNGPAACGFCKVGMYCPAPVPRTDLLHRLTKHMPGHMR